MSIRYAWGEAIGKELGLGGEVQFTSTLEGRTLHLPCAHGHTEDFALTGMHLPPEIVKKKMRQAGWGVSRRLTCPDHNPKRIRKIITRKIKEITKPKELPMPEPETNVSPLTPTSEVARTARRLATMLIEEQFDVEGGFYKNGYTDKKVADETGVSEHFVTKRREEDFGPLKEPPEIAKAKAEINDLENRVSELEDHCAKVVENMRRDITAHRQNLATLIRKNGWAN